MKNALTIARKEIRIYFVSPLFYVVTALFVLATGFFFALNVINQLTASMDVTFNVVLFVMLLWAPVLTMRLIAQEKQQGTIELLLTTPVRDIDVVVGKFLAALVMFIALMATTLIAVLVLLWTAVDRSHILFLSIGHISWGTLLAGYFGNILIGAGYLAIGIMASTLTQNQIVAAVISFVILLILLVASTAAGVFQPPLSDFFNYIGPRDHSQAFARGAIALPDLVYSLSLIGIPLYIAVLSLGARRWH